MDAIHAFIKAKGEERNSPLESGNKNTPATLTTNVVDCHKLTVGCRKVDVFEGKR